MKAIQRGIKLAACGMCVAVLASQVVAVTVEADSWNVLDTFGNVSCATPAAGTITLAFPAIQFPIPSEATIAPASSDPAVQFVGDYAGAGIQDMTFSITGTGAQLSEYSSVVLKGTERRWNRYNLNVSETPGEATANRISFSSADGWVTSDPSLANATEEEVAAALASDMQNVTLLAITALKKWTATEQLFTISGFSVQGDRNIGSLTPLEQALLDAFDKTNLTDLTEEEAARDTDGDGMSDLNEILAVYSPGYFAETLFKVRAVAADSGMAIVWACVEGKTYKVMRSNDLRAPGSFEEIHSAVADKTGFMMHVDEDITEGSEYFYRVTQE